MTAPRPEMSANVRVGDLAPSQQRAMRALLNGGTATDAARSAGVTPRTIHRWMSDDGFRSAYRSAARAAASEALSALLSAQSAAVRTLVGCLDSPSHAVRVRAARALLEVGVRAATDDLDQRVGELETEVAAWRNGPRLSVV